MWGTPSRREKECFHCHKAGHLAKHCLTAAKASSLATEEDEEEKRLGLVYTPPRRLKFDADSDRAAFVQRVKAFKYQSRKARELRPELYKPMMEEVLAYLVWAHGHAKGLMVPSRDVRLAFRGNSIKDRAGELTFADTSAMTGYITFSTTAIERGLHDGSESGYPCEEPCLERYCRGRLKEEYLMWLVLHEFTHLFAGFNHDRHDRAFFDRVSAFADEHSFLFE